MSIASMYGFCASLGSVFRALSDVLGVTRTTVGCPRPGCESEDCKEHCQCHRCECNGEPQGLKGKKFRRKCRRCERQCTSTVAQKLGFMSPSSSSDGQQLMKPHPPSQVRDTFNVFHDEAVAF